MILITNYFLFVAGASQKRDFTGVKNTAKCGSFVYKIIQTDDGAEESRQ